MNTASAKRQLQNFKGFHGCTGDPAQEAGDLVMRTGKRKERRGEGELERRKGRRVEREEAEKNDHLGRQKIKENFLNF